MWCSNTILTGYGSILLSLVSWEAAGAAAQGLQRVVPDFQLSLIRDIVIASISGIFVYMRNTAMYIPRENYIYVLLTSIFGILSDVLFFSGVSFLPLSQATGIFFATRMIILAIITKFYFGDHVNIFMIIGVIGSIVGLTFQAQPWNVFSRGFIPGFLQEINCSNLTMTVLAWKDKIHGNITCESIDRINQISIAVLLILGHMIMILAAMMSSLHMICIGVYLKSVDPSLICFITTLLCIPISLMLALYLEQPVYIDNPLSVLLIIIHAVCAAFTELFENISYQILPPLQASIIESIQPFMSLILQYTIFRQHLAGRMNFLEVLGCFFLIASFIVSTFSSMGYDQMD